MPCDASGFKLVRLCLRQLSCVTLALAWKKILARGVSPAMIGHGGLCAKIIESGDIALGDAITVLPPLEG
jgi:MOSC domain-containing protein YiiM